MKEHQGLQGTRGRSIRRAAAAFVPAALLPILAGTGALWAQPPAGTPANMPATAQTAVANELDPKAIEALKRTSGFLRTLNSFAVHSEATKDEVLVSGQKIQLANTVALRARVPDRLRIDVKSDRKQRQIYYDGTTVTQYAPRINYYASVPAPRTIRETLRVAADTYGLELPLADLFFWGTEQSGIEDITSAIAVGPSRAAGVECDQYAFSQAGVDWQIWIERGKAPLPRKLVITTRDEPSQPQYTALLRWDLNPQVTDKTFTFVPPKGARKITFAPLSAAK